MLRSVSQPRPDADQIASRAVYMASTPSKCLVNVRGPGESAKAFTVKNLNGNFRRLIGEPGVKSSTMLNLAGNSNVAATPVGTRDVGTSIIWNCSPLPITHSCTRLTRVTGETRSAQIPKKTVCPKCGWPYDLKEVNKKGISPVCSRTDKATDSYLVRLGAGKGSSLPAPFPDGPNQPQTFTARAVSNPGVAVRYC